MTLIARVAVISEFSSEILENDELRINKLHALEDLEGEETQLLHQVNLTIDSAVKKNSVSSFKKYQENLDGFCVLVEYQQALISVLAEISGLKYLLGRGRVSSEMSYSMFSKYLALSTQTRGLLEDWHAQQIGSHGIDLVKSRRNKTGIDGFFSHIPGVFHDDWKYKPLEKGLTQKISDQLQERPLAIDRAKDLYDEDVQIIIKDGKYYYCK